MMEEVSAGGVVIFGNTILLLKKFNGDWVLPKGRVEKDETLKETALREVLEESGVKAEAVKYIGMVHYKYKNLKENEMVYKTVHWYLMKTNSMDCTPQKKEGFVDAVFVHIDKAKNLVRYQDEKNIIIKGLKML
ncbi:NUDIX hydrolase [Tissierella sp. MB52-C2]|uniref:NUDIX hydrolase n=1 Tax=Tissierella sp. MB52-C2 TaxID=3070999 RepID=UPI00280B25B5|nr:NUDIX hydrolase [Tissierella sp. MB52-C2]WMM25990.1 NUDIX hydrolase [Tissierella sp. MB52-C2]